MFLLLHVVVGTQLQSNPGMTVRVQIMTCTPSLVHQLGAEDLASGLPFAHSTHAWPLHISTKHWKSMNELNS